MKASGYLRLTPKVSSLKLPPKGITDPLELNMGNIGHSALN